ncbi:glucose 1-dehydrogenase [Ktedonosporobacter rubrisoli]|uniref:Glucose 1-dehydrogenase n=1 Tax=Ktedonosporobacter rubrisoli TaxID=2509675 RepID=A0A4P6JJ87_KTERU|nr:glucose 1-dehydrogenase [Ktedonosporobacter rubrisoli]QBD74982.1 glucose 1-dehydrogenase [Ktedonosporobacter rubrisoli]
MLASMAGKVALVVGGSSGIGQATALAFARHGAQVVIASRRIAKMTETIRQIQEIRGEAIFVPTDVTKASDIAALVDKTVKEYGRLDYAFNNAEVGTSSASLVDLSEEEWDYTVAVNLKGIWLSLKYQIPAMLATGGGAIVNMASVGGIIGASGLAVYSATKAGVIGLSRVAALEYAKANIRINAISPSGITTETFLKLPADVRAHIEAANPIGRLGIPREIADAVVWLCSDEASFMLGQNLIIDGGATAQ